MDQNLANKYSSNSDAIVKVAIKETNIGEKTNKCNQCKYVSSWTSALKTHLKIHSGEKSNKCNQYDYASSQEGHTNLADATNASMH